MDQCLHIFSARFRDFLWKKLHVLFVVYIININLIFFSVIPGFLHWDLSFSLSVSLCLPVFLSLVRYWVSCRSFSFVRSFRFAVHVSYGPVCVRADFPNVNNHVEYVIVGGALCQRSRILSASWFRWPPWLKAVSVNYSVI